MATYSYQNLQVWQFAMDLCEEVYKVCLKLPKSEIYALADQLKRAAVSVPSNIAEGQKRLNRQETIQFTGIALGSVAELETQLLLAKRIYNIELDETLILAERVSKMLTALIKSLKSKI